MDQLKIGRFLRELRREKNITQEQLAEKMGVTARTVSRWETGSNMPDISLLIELADFYDVQISEILDGERKVKNDMDKELKETMLKAADYEKEQHKIFTRNICAIFIAGFMLFTAYLVMSAMEIPCFDDSIYAGFMIGFSYGTVILGVLYASGIMGRIYEWQNKNIKPVSKVFIAVSLLIALGFAALTAVSIKTYGTDYEKAPYYAICAMASLTSAIVGIKKNIYAKKLSENRSESRE